jgi:Holliday junction resolvase RusA-like endonuclease
MYRLDIKALSLNSAYRGRRFETPTLKKFKQDLYYSLPRIFVYEGKLKVKYIFGVSSKNSDGDNLIKCFQDALADRYGFNDKQIYQWEVQKMDVPKGKEFIEFSIENFI